jgi:hypothetical protein
MFERPSDHSITSSARRRNDSGIERSSALAVVPVVYSRGGSLTRNAAIAAACSPSFVAAARETSPQQTRLATRMGVGARRA